MDSGPPDLPGETNMWTENLHDRQARELMTSYRFVSYVLCLCIQGLVKADLELCPRSRVSEAITPHSSAFHVNLVDWHAYESFGLHSQNPYDQRKTLVQ